MMDTTQASRIVLASNNAGKLRELRELLSGSDFALMPQAALQITAADETGLTFIENAILKARHAADQSGLPAIADDSGLAVDALGGAPGVDSAYYAGRQASDRDNVEKLLEAMTAVPDGQRSARFHCIIVFLRHARDPSPLIGQGVWEGRIAKVPQGESGFGYDPVFLVADSRRTAAQLTAAEKNQLSHRGQALRSLVEQLRAGHQR